MRPTIASQHQLSCRSTAPLLWQPHPFHDESSLVFTERLSTWARNCLSVWRRIVTTHLCCNLKIGKIPISNSFRAILQNISLRHMGGLCIYGHICRKSCVMSCTVAREFGAPMNSCADNRESRHVCNKHTHHWVLIAFQHCHAPVHNKRIALSQLLVSSLATDMTHFVTCTMMQSDWYHTFLLWQLTTILIMPLPFIKEERPEDEASQQQTTPLL